MGPSGDLLDRMCDILGRFYNCEKSKDPDGRYRVLVRPYPFDTMSFEIREIEGADAVYVSNEVKIPDRLVEIFRTMDPAIVAATKDDFGDVFASHGQVARFNKSHDLITCRRILLTEGIREQEILDIIGDYLALNRDMLKILKAITTEMQFEDRRNDYDMFK